MLGFELADQSLGLVVEDDDDLVGVLFRVVKSQAAARFFWVTSPSSRLRRLRQAGPGRRGLDRPVAQRSVYLPTACMFLTMLSLASAFKPALSLDQEIVV